MRYTGYAWVPVSSGKVRLVGREEGGGDPLMRSYCAADGPSVVAVVSVLPIPAISSPS